MSKGFKCECGRYHQYGSYVVAHSDTKLIHLCGCGREHSIFRFNAELIKPSKLGGRPRKGNK